MNSRELISAELETLRDRYSELFFRELEIQREKCKISNRIIALSNKFADELQNIKGFK